MSEQITKARKEFQDWYGASGMPLEHSNWSQLDVDGDYGDDHVQTLWRAWEAAFAAQFDAPEGPYNPKLSRCDPCPHGWEQECPHCMKGEIARLQTVAPVGEFYLVPREIIDQFPEINVNNYDHDNACALNAWGCEVVTTANPAPPPSTQQVRELTIKLLDFINAEGPNAIAWRPISETAEALRAALDQKPGEQTIYAVGGDGTFNEDDESGEQADKTKPHLTYAVYDKHGKYLGRAVLSSKP